MTVIAGIGIVSEIELLLVTELGVTIAPLKDVHACRGCDGGEVVAEAFGDHPRQSRCGDMKNSCSVCTFDAEQIDAQQPALRVQHLEKTLLEQKLQLSFVHRQGSGNIIRRCPVIGCWGMSVSQHMSGGIRRIETSVAGDRHRIVEAFGSARGNRQLCLRDDFRREKCCSTQQGCNSHQPSDPRLLSESCHTFQCRRLRALCRGMLESLTVFQVDREGKQKIGADRMSMTRREAALITRLWRGWILDRKTNNQAYREFVLDVIRAESSLQHLSVFDILDAVVNGEAWEAVAGKRCSEPDGSAARRTRTGKSAEDRTSGQSGTPRIVEIEESAN